MLDSTGFDLWANGYDKSVNLSEKNNEYPFAGYKDVLNYVYNQVRKEDGANVLDIGFGTGILATQLYNNGYSVTGIDFSSNMIDIAKQKMPQATLINRDFSKGLSDEIKNHHFDFIISTYAIHHLTDKEKINFIKSFFPLLNKTGKIFLGDVSFETRNQLEKCKAKYNEYWDNDEFYFTAEEIKNNLNDEYFCEYIQISHCAGVLIIANK
ncbi:class I SAM-dependent methyltransferase [Clostridium estertheticum]|uniref:class I SAM-dependent methyltransferase n=1 Tax=Clostridium estertheticum TaxID=238834 RepID=UPI0016523DFC|nr:class I SAM-dependent methyltransferase [Clostridium estertheticum]MBZ9685487.1 class I SAM-dependent methyltransferase [Clostridium estertheticum]